MVERYGPDPIGQLYAAEFQRVDAILRERKASKTKQAAAHVGGNETGVKGQHMKLPVLYMTSPAHLHPAQLAEAKARLVKQGQQRNP